MLTFSNFFSKADAEEVEKQEKQQDAMVDTVNFETLLGSVA